MDSFLTEVDSFINTRQTQEGCLHLLTDLSQRQDSMAIGISLYDRGYSHTVTDSVFNNSYIVSECPTVNLCPRGTIKTGHL